MSISTAKEVLNFILKNSRNDETIQIGFFGGEPLLEFDLIREITALIKNHNSFRPDQISISVTTNGTILSEEITDFLAQNNIIPGISCDGPPEIHDLNRPFPDGRGSSALVESNIKRAVNLFPLLPVNAVYCPNTLEFLPNVVDYLASLGVKNIVLSPNISAKWTQKEADMLPKIYTLIGERFADFYSQGKPKYIDLIDSKIAVILRGGYKPHEKCRMGKGELAFSTTGEIYPCERLAGACTQTAHCIGNINRKLPIRRRLTPISSVAKNGECLTCGLKEYCVNWCGCSNFFATGSYNKVGAFQCASEKAALTVASHIINEMKDSSSIFSHHLAGTPLMNITEEV